MRALVLDASVGLKLVRMEEGSEAASDLVTQRLPSWIAVPPIFWLEVINVLARRYGYPGADVLEALHDLESLGIRTLPDDRPGRLAVIDLVERHELTSYDAAYLALAESLDADLATADRRLALAAGDRGAFIGPDQGIAEERAAYRPRPATWPSWTDVGAYLAELRGAPPA
ncbi:MAG: type II toxin-antitoxin system VapC family toxin [Candidatus Limnocylindria bacterium]